MLKYTHLLTIVFVTLKLAAVTEVASWSWWLVFLPTILSAGISLALIVLGLVVVALTDD